MPDRLIFRRATPDDDRRILDLYESSFAREIPEDWWRWFTYQCPTGPNRTSVVEDPDTGRLAGSYSLLPIKLKINNQIVSASLCTNVNTHPEYQRRGLFTRIGHFALQSERDFDTPISLGMPNQAAILGHMKVGWDVMCKLPLLVKHNCQPRKHHCREVESFDERLDSFCSLIGERFSFIVLKDHRFMNWRVVSRPQKQYTKYIFEEGHELKGYAVLKHFEENGARRCHILDIHADTVEVLQDLIAAAESFAHGTDELNMWTNPHNPYHEQFLKQGFYERESKDSLIIHFNYSDKETIDERAWWFCLADNDVY